MTTGTQRIVGTSIVLVGSFNPAIIHPSWFARFDILPPSDFDEDETDVQLVNPDFSLFSIGWLRVQATVDHFELSTLEEDRAPLLRDAGVNIFTQLMHTPVSAMGINRTAHFPLDKGGWAEIQSALAPAQPWAKLAEGAALSSLTIQTSRTGDESDPGCVRVTIEPSQRIRDGVFISVNDHYDFTSADEFGEAGPALRILDSEWSAAISRHDEYTGFVLALAGGS